MPDELLDDLLSVFSARGFDGASLQELARASNRSKASLYHHFPSGKRQMIEVLVERSNKTLDRRAFLPLRAANVANSSSRDKESGKKTSNKKNDKKAAKNLTDQQSRALLAVTNFVDGFAGYLGAQKGNCLLATLALSQPELLGSKQRNLQKNWLATLARALELCGHKPKAAKRLAQAVMARLYGSLTLTAMGSPVSMEQACKWLKKDLLRR